MILLEPFRNLLQVVDDRQMLRADAFALAAGNAGGCRISVLGKLLIALEIGCMVGTLPLLLIVYREEFRNGDIHRASRCAVMASRARDCDTGIDNICYRMNGGQFQLVQGLEILHKGSVVFELVYI